MAVITNIFAVIDMNLDDKAKAYLESLLDNKSETMKRIYALDAPSFVRYDITDEIFAIEQTFFTKDRIDCFFESHKKYVDIQIVLDGIECIELAHRDELDVDMEYDAEKDLMKHKDYTHSHKLCMKKHSAAVFYPEDAHLCVQQIGKSVRVYKTVLKVPVEKLK